MLTINQVLVLKGLHWHLVGNSMLFGSFKYTCPPRDVCAPSRNMILVLHSLLLLLVESSDRHLTLKTVLLLALASSKEVSCMASLVTSTTLKDEIYAFPIFVLEFMAKTQNSVQQDGICCCKDKPDPIS